MLVKGIHQWDLEVNRAGKRKLYQWDLEVNRAGKRNLYQWDLEVNRAGKRKLYQRADDFFLLRFKISSLRQPAFCQAPRLLHF